MRSFLRTLRAGAWLISLAAAATSARAADCDRECLRGFLTAYLNALVAHQPDAVPAAPAVKFTEDGAILKLGEGNLWKSITGLTTFRQDFLDVREGVAAAHVKVQKGSSPALLCLRLKISGGKITEVETLVTNNQAEGMIFDINAIQTASQAMAVVPAKPQLNSREEMIRIAALYPAGLKAGSFAKADVPFAPEAYRFENGRLMAGPGCTFIPGCQDIKGQRIPTLAGIKYRVAAVDEELGIVLLRLDFGPGSVSAGNTLIPFEAFKVYGGQIHAVEAFMKVMPAGAPSGWD